MEKKLGDAAASQSLRGSLLRQIGNPPEIIDQAGGDRSTTPPSLYQAANALAASVIFANAA